MNVLFLITLGFYIYILYWIWKLENTGCVCSKDWRRNFIVFWMIFYLPLMLLTKNNKINKNILLILLFFVNIIFIIVVFQYVHKLKNEKCKCADGTELQVLEIFNYLQIALLIIGSYFLITLLYEIVTYYIEYKKFPKF